MVELNDDPVSILILVTSVEVDDQVFRKVALTATEVRGGNCRFRNYSLGIQQMRGHPRNRR